MDFDTICVIISHQFILILGDSPHFAQMIVQISSKITEK